MDGFSDLLTDAFSESSVPSFSDGDFDFESLDLEEKGDEDKTENSTTKTDEALLQEVTDESDALPGKATTDTLLTAEDKESMGNESDDEEFMRKESEDSSESSEEERSSSGEAEEPGDLLMSVCCRDDPYGVQIKGGIFAFRQSMASDGADSPRNEVRGEAESDEEASCFRAIPEWGDERGMMEEAEEATGEVSSDSNHEDMTVEHEEKVLPQETETPYKISPMVEDNLEFSCLSLLNLQDLITEVDGEEQVKMTDFTGDEHQEAGETIADYPSDFSSGDFSRAELNTSPLLKQEHEAATGTSWTDRTEDPGYEKDDGFLYSTDLELNADKITSLDGAAGEVREHLSAVMTESNSYSFSDDKEPLRGTRDELSSDQDIENNTNPEDVRLQELSWGRSFDNTIKARSDPADFIRSGFDPFSTDTRLTEFLSTTEVLDDTEDSSSDDNQCPAEDENCYSVVNSEKTRRSNQGSIDDSFFFDTKSSEVTEQPVDDEDEEKKNAEQMQKRIEAFERFYNSDDENRGEERQKKVQFREEPLSQVYESYYDSDNSDRESLSSSTDTEEDQNYEKLKGSITEPKDLLREHEYLLREPKDMTESKDTTEPKDLLREPEHLLRESKDMTAPEDLLREHEHLLREPKDLLREHEGLLRESKDLLWEHEDLPWESKDMTEPEDLLRESKDLLREHEDLPWESKDMTEPEDLLREHEDLPWESKDMTEPEDLLKEHERLLRESKDMTEPEDPLREPEDLLREPEDLLRKHKGKPREFEDTPEITPMREPPNPEQPQSVSDVRDTQTSTNTYKGISKLKLMLNLGVVTTMGLLMFWLITDQSDWLRDLFSV